MMRSYASQSGPKPVSGLGHEVVVSSSPAIDVVVGAAVVDVVDPADGASGSALVVSGADVSREQPDTRTSRTTAAA
jgi:hypothetical protein